MAITSPKPREEPLPTEAPTPPPSPAPAPTQAPVVPPAGGYPLGEGSEPNPGDPAHENPLEHLKDVK